MQITCTNCQSTVRVPDSLAGKQGMCPKCGTVLDIPAVPPPPEPAEPPAPPTPEASASPPRDEPTERDAASPAAAEKPEREGAGAATATDEQLPAPGAEGTAASPATPLPPDQETQAPETKYDPTATAPPAYAFLAPAQAPDELGRLGPFRVLKVLGQGGMGVVFVAEDVQLGRRVALKAMLPEVANKPAARERFQREARTAATIEHDHIVPIYHVEEDREIPYIVMPLLKGCSLEDWLRRQNEWPLPVPFILRLGRQVAQGLAAAHAHGLIHRDIKPANIFLQEPAANPAILAPPIPEYRVKILDFGLARSRTGDSHLTMSGVIMGTPSYMAPEQARSGSKVDGRADIFSLGVVLYRLCTGLLPFKGDDTMSVLMSLAMDNPPPPREIYPSLPAALSGLVMRMLEKEPMRRIASADEVVFAIEAMEGLPHSPPGPGPRPPAIPETEEPPIRRARDTDEADAPATQREPRRASSRIKKPTAERAPPPVPRELPEENEPETRRRPRPTEPGDEDEWDRLGIEKENTALSVASMSVGIASAVLGLMATCCCVGAVASPAAIIGGATAIILGVVGMKRGGHVYAYTGIALGGVGILLGLTYLAMFVLGMGAQFIPAIINKK